MSQKNLFFDFDGMKFDTLPWQVEYFNNKYQIKTSVSEFRSNSYDLQALLKKHIPSSPHINAEIYHDFHENFISSLGEHQHVLPMEYMCEVVKELAKKYTLWTVTARHVIALPVIHYLLSKYIPGCIYQIHCVYNGCPQKGYVEVSKKDFISSIPGKNIAFFDDSLHEIEKVKDLIPSYLFDPLDEHGTIEGVTSIRNWKEIGDRFL